MLAGNEDLLLTQSGKVNTGRLPSPTRLESPRPALMAVRDRVYPRVRTTLGQQREGQASERDLGELSTRVCEAGGWVGSEQGSPGMDTGCSICSPGPLHRGLGSGDGHWLDCLPFRPPVPWPGLRGWTLAGLSTLLGPCTVAWAPEMGTGWTICPSGPLHRGLGSGDGHWLLRGTGTHSQGASDSQRPCTM